MQARPFFISLRVGFLCRTFLLLKEIGQVRKRLASWRIAFLVFPIPLLLITWLALQVAKPEKAPDSVPRQDAKADSISIVKPDWLPNALEAALGWEIAGTFLLALPVFLYELHRARKRIMIREFRRFKGSQEISASKDGAPGIAALLGNELLRTEKLYRTVDEVSASQTGTIVRASPSVFSPGRVTEDLGVGVGLDVSIPLGKIQVPVGSLLGALAWLVRGPRLTGTLHEDPDSVGPDQSVKRYWLVARLSGGGVPSGTWKVDVSNLAAEDQGLTGTALVQRLVEILAIRITTDLVDLGSPRWQAVRQYTEGLRELRMAQHRSRSRIGSLREAEKRFRSALEEDEHFAQAHFNLGLVYRELHEDPAARLAFRHAIKEDPGHDKACYALAESYYETGTYEDAIWLAHNAAAIRGLHAGAWNLHSQAVWARDSKRKGVSLENPVSPTKQIVKGFETAALTALRELCRAQFHDQNVDEARDIARICLGRLGSAYSRKGCDRSSHLLHWASRVAFRTALFLAPNDSDVNYELGRARWRAEDYKGAHAAFDRVFEDGLDLAVQTDLWAYLLSTHSRLSLRARDESRKAKHQDDATDAYTLARDTLAIPDWAFPEDADPQPFPRDADQHHLTKRFDGQQKRDYRQRLLRYDKTLEEINASARATIELSSLAKLKRDRTFLLTLEDRDRGELWKDLVVNRDIRPPDVEGLAPDQDWKEWAHEQTVTRFADRYFAEAGDEPEVLRPLIGAMTEALERVEKRRFSSPFESRLREHLAHACLVLHQQLQGKDDAEKYLDQALNYAERAVQRNPQSREGLLLLGQIHMEMDDVEQACEDLEICLHLPPDFPQAIDALGLALWKRAEGCGNPGHRRHLLKEAAKRFDGILKLAESDPLIGHETHRISHGWLGRYRCGTGKYDDGLYHLGIALKMGKPSPDLLLAAAEARAGRAEAKEDILRTEDLAEAERLVKRARALRLSEPQLKKCEDLEARLRGAGRLPRAA